MPCGGRAVFFFYGRASRCLRRGIYTGHCERRMVYNMAALLVEVGVGGSAGACLSAVVTQQEELCFLSSLVWGARDAMHCGLEALSTSLAHAVSSG